MSLFDTLLGEEVGRADAVRNDAQNIFLKQRYLKLQREGKFDEAVASLQPGYVPSEEAASAPSASGPLSTSPEIQGLLTAARRAQEEAAQANVGRDEAPIGDHQRDEGFNYSDYDGRDITDRMEDQNISIADVEGWRRPEPMTALEKAKEAAKFTSAVAGGPVGLGGYALGKGINYFGSEATKARNLNKMMRGLEDTAGLPVIDNYNWVDKNTGTNAVTGSIPGGSRNNYGLGGGIVSDMDPMSQSLLDAENANTFGFGDIVSGLDGGVGSGSVSDPGPAFGGGPDLFNPGDFTPFTATPDDDRFNTGTFVRFPSALDNPEMPLTLNNLNNAIANSFGAGRDVLVRSGGLLGEIGEHPDAQIKGGGLLNTGPQPFVNSPTFTGAGIDVATLAEQSKAALEQRKMNDAAAAQAAAVNAANIAANISRPDEEERYEPEKDSVEEYESYFG